MPILTATAIILLKKTALKGGLSLSTKLLQEVSSNPHMTATLDKFAHEMGMGATQEFSSFLSENIDTFSNFLERASDLL